MHGFSVLTASLWPPTARGYTRQTTVDVPTAKAALSAAVKAGRIPKSEATALLEQIKEHTDNGGEIILEAHSWGQQVHVFWKIPEGSVTSISNVNIHFYGGHFPLGRFRDAPAYQSFARGELREEAWYQDGKLHRTGQPASISPNKSVWYENGQLHRTGGPAIETTDGGEWYEYGLRHRSNDEPAIDYPKHKQWFVDGKPYRANGEYTEIKKGVKYWQNSRRCIHRDGAPAVIYPRGKEEWYQDGVRHREDGPAVDYGSRSRWYWKGNKTTELGLQTSKALFESKNKVKALQTKTSDEPRVIRFVG